MNKTITTILLILTLIIIFTITFKLSKSEERQLSASPIGNSTNFDSTFIGKLIFPDETNNNCINCHKGIDPIRDPKSEMMQEIYALAEKAGFKNNECIVCHGGNPDTKDKLKAHNGSIIYFKNNQGPEEFYPNPASVWINARTCGMCHIEQVSTQFTSLMFTEAGKIQGATWGFGGLQGYDHDVANLAVDEVDVH